MQYFQTRFETLSSIAIKCGFDGLAGYLVLARHTTGRKILEYPPHTLSGAGVNSIHEKLGCSEYRARSILDRLVEAGFVQPPPADAKESAPRSARWILPQQYPLDVEVPHAFVDAPKLTSSAVSSPLKRLKKMRPLEGQAQADANCDAAMLLVAIYASIEMRKYGGLSPTNSLHRKWKTLSVKPADLDECFVWKAEPGTDSAYTSFVHSALPHVEEQETINRRFWNAVDNLKDCGLIYETVSFFDEKDVLVAPLRVNDFHAGSITEERNGDPSLMKELERHYGTRFAFYSQSDETLKVTLPFAAGKLYGIYRPRIRPSTEDVGVWAKEDEERVKRLFLGLSTKVSDDYDDDF